MLHHIIGTIIGALVTYALLLVLIPGSTYNSQFVTAIVIGAIACAIWPWFIGFMLVRRAKNKRDANIQAEVERQVNQQKGG